MAKYSIAVRFTNAIGSVKQLKDLEIPLTINFEKDDINRLVNVKWLKSTIRGKVSECENKRLRLIYNGRVLNEITDFKKDIFDPKLRQEADNSKTEDKLYIHCVIGEELTADQMAKENQLDNRPQEVTTQPEVTGFDRLLQQGFSLEDINDLRTQFHSIYNPDLLGTNRNDQINDLEEEESRRQTQRQLEERWMESTVRSNPEETIRTEQQPAANNFQAPPQPSADLDDSRGNEDLLIGLLIGIFLGVVSLVFLIADHTVFNKRQKMSVIAGVFINFSFAITRGQWI